MPKPTKRKDGRYKELVNNIHVQDKVSIRDVITVLKSGTISHTVMFKTRVTKENGKRMTTTSMGTEIIFCEA